jgi:hypothetical protein
MIEHEVTMLQPGATDSMNPGSGVWESQYSADVLIQPPIKIGKALGKFIGGNVGNIIITEVASTSEATHATIACGQGRASYNSGAEAVELAVDRLRKYLNTENTLLGVLGVEFAQEPLLKGYNPREM